MAFAREIIGNRIPFSTEAYEWVDHRRRRRITRSQIASLLASGKPIKLDIGGGYRPGSNGWLNVDTAFEADLYWDLREGVPFPTGSVSAVFHRICLSI